MPTYEYECTKCGHEFEAFQSITAQPLARCPACKGKVKRLLGTGGGIIFKGSGFYQTDYRSASYTSGKRAEESKSTSSSTDSGKKTATTKKGAG